MKRNKKTKIIFLCFLSFGFLLFLLMGCHFSPSPSDPFYSTSEHHLENPVGEVNTIDQGSAAKGGPLLLIQTGFSEYQLLNPAAQTSYPFALPTENPHFRLRDHQSPSGKLLLIPKNIDEGVILELKTSEIVQSYNFENQDLFDPDHTATLTKPIAENVNLTKDEILKALNQSHHLSRQLLRWYQNDSFLLSVKDSGQSSTSLFLEDLQTGKSIQLDYSPGFVEDFSINTAQHLILLKKGYIFTSNPHQDKHYYLINGNDLTSGEIPIPADIVNPSVNWICDNLIGITHQSHLNRGSGFSLFDIEKWSISQIINSEFSHLISFNQNLLVIRNAPKTRSTVFELLTYKGELLASQTIDKTCHYQASHSNFLFVQCDLKSYIFDDNLKVQPFIDSFTSLPTAPDGNATVLVNRSGQTFLLDANFQIQAELNLLETPLEIQWLPTSNGFIYRALGKLYYYDLIKQQDFLLLESDLFSDYTNMNAVWLNRD